MKDQIELTADERSVLGKKVKHLRREGIVPAVVRGHNMDPMPIQMERDQIVQALRRGGTTAIMRMKVGKRRPFSVAVADLHVDPVTGRLLHADFQRVEAHEKLRMKVPLHFEGEAPVLESHDAALVRSMTEINVECLPADLPSHVPVDLTKLVDLNSTLRISDLTPIDRVTFLEGPDEVIVAVSATAKEAALAEEAAAAEEAIAAGAAEETGEATGEQDSSRPRAA